MDLKNKRVGVWGFGVVGKAATLFLDKLPCTITIFDQKPLTAEQIAWLAARTMSPIIASDLTSFLEENDYIIPSPGICIAPYYEKYRKKWVAELDIFAQHTTTPIIAITGSVGKTTVTTLLAAILTQYQKKITVGGNIGIASLDLLENQKDADFTVLEISSYQLAYTHIFAPTLAIITNFWPNHLDWHGTLEHYAQAKGNIFAHQTENQHVLIPFDFQRHGVTLPHNRPLHFFSTTKPTESQLSTLSALHTVFFIENEWVVHLHNNTYTHLYCISHLPNTTFAQNWLIIIAALHMLTLPLEHVSTYAAAIPLPAHRLEKIAHQQIPIYDDSKSTTPAATLAAVEKLSAHPIHLFIGGMSKGIDREPMIAALQTKVTFMYCFGGEAATLAQLCTKYQIPHQSFATLEPAVAACRDQIQPGQQILFSPAGSSFDLFKNYEDRGQQFKKLISHYFVETK